MAKQINSCPFCGCGSSPNEGVILYSYFKKVEGEEETELFSYVYCRKCKAHGPEVTGSCQRTEAVILWNRASAPLDRLLCRLDLALDMCDEDSPLQKTLLAIKRDAK